MASPIQRSIIDVRMNDGTEYRNIVTNLRDQQRFSDLREARRWSAEDQMLVMRVLAWAALCRLGKFDGGYDAFLDATEIIVPVEESQDVDPTVTAIQGD
ncbi:hypothetical protein [Gordonia sp. CPCC 205333]|uniref:hypothetical protein n=1 Tax=Gordonia sp. CPCC 205333 TaxID=3140790 RepID=UPI003AF357F8